MMNSVPIKEKQNLSGVPEWSARLLLILLPVVCFLISLCMGRYGISLKEVIQILFSAVMPSEQKINPMAVNLLLRIRLPRIISAMVVGSALTVSGAVFQGVFHNPLADPSTLGVSNGAGFGAALGILLLNTLLPTQFSALLFGLISVIMTFAVSHKMKHSTVALVLGGVIVSSFFSAFVSLLKFIADPMEKLPAIVFWLMGSLATVNAAKLASSTPFFLSGFVVIFLYRWRINVLSMGDGEAASFGVEVRRDRLILIICCTLLTAAAVSISGVIGWVGLVVPHLGRILVGPDYRKLLPACLSMGASYLLIVDTLCRNLMNVEIPLGVVTALIGTPLFAYYMFREKVNW